MEELPDTILDHQPDSIEDKYFEAYFGPQSSYYVQKYALYKSGRAMTFNFAPFFVSFFWLLYRKLYIYAIVAFGILTAFDLGEAYLFQILSIDFEIQRIISLVVTIGFAVVFGFLGNYLYLQKAESDVRNVLAATRDEETRIQMLEKKGGTSWAPVLVVVAGMVIMTFMEVLHL